MDQMVQHPGANDASPGQAKHHLALECHEPLPFESRVTAGGKLSLRLSHPSVEALEHLCGRHRPEGNILPGLAWRHFHTSFTQGVSEPARDGCDMPGQAAQ